MLRPFLAIGIGGSGGKTLRTMRSELVRRLAQHGWSVEDQGFPTGWRMLHIDTPSKPEGADSDLPQNLDADQYLPLVLPGINYRDVDQSLVSSGQGALEGLVGWRPTPDDVKVAISAGAGQARAIGRVITLTKLADIADAIDAESRALISAQVAAELASISEMFGAKPEVRAPQPLVLVVTSLAGGSGSGALLDVCDVVRAKVEWGSDSIGVLYTPDVFQDIASGMARGVQGNTLAALSEVMAGFWSDGLSESTASLMASQGVPAHAKSRSGPRYPFLVGASNSTVALGTQNDVYRSVGTALAALATSPHLQDNFVAYTLGNWPTAAGISDSLPFKLGSEETPFNAMGCARVSLGRDRFGVYVAEWLARASVERLLRRHLDTASASAENNPETVIAKAVDSSWLAFLHESKLDELGSENNAIIEALRPPAEAKQAWSRASSRILERLQSRQVGKKGVQPASDWSQPVQQQLQMERTHFMAEEKTALLERSAAWVADIQQHIVSLISSTVAEQGLPVTRRLLDKLVAELNNVAEELPAEATAHEAEVAKLEGQVATTIAPLKDQRIPANHQAIRQSIGQGVKAMDVRMQQETLRLSTELVKDIVRNLLSPMQRALRDAYETLTSAERPALGLAQTDVPRWPEGNTIPATLEPVATEFLVDPVREYPEMRRRLIRASFTPVHHNRDAEQQALMSIITGQTDHQGPEQRLIEVSAEWKAAAPELVTMQGPAQTARLRFRVKPNELLERARAALTDRDTPIKQYLDQSFADYLDESDAGGVREHQRQVKRFRDAFAKAVNAAEPFASIHTPTLKRVHGLDAPRIVRTFSELPFSESTPEQQDYGYDAVKDVLVAADAWEPARARELLTDEPRAHIDLFGTLASPLEPLVFSSLMKPIAQDWAPAKANPETKAQWWRFRRARSLPDFVPFSPWVRRSVVRGWFTAGLLNQITVGSDGSLSVFRPAPGGKGNWLALPFPMLGPSNHYQTDRVALVLKAASLAMLDASLGEWQAIDAYSRLRSLGSPQVGSETDYDVLNGELAGWLKDGDSGRAAPTPLIADDATSFESRKEAATGAIESVFRVFDEGPFSEVVAVETLSEVSRAWELREDIAGALRDLHRAVGEFKPQQTTRGVIF